MNIMQRGLISCLTLTIFFNAFLFPSEEVKISDNTQKTNLEKLADINMKAFPWKQESWSTNSWQEFLTRHLQTLTNPKACDKRSAAFSIVIDDDKKNDTQKSSSVMFNDTTTWDDLNLFCGKSNPEKFVANTIDNTLTEYGKVALYALLAHPTDNRDILLKRQAIIKFFIEHQDIFKELRSLLQTIHNAENYTLSFWYQNDPLHHTCEEEWMFTNPLTKPLNNSETMLTINSFYMHQNRTWQLGLSVFSSLVLFCYSTLLLTNIIEMPKKLQEWADRYKNDNLIFTILNLSPNKNAQAIVALLSGIYGSFTLKHIYDWVQGGFLFEKTLHIIVQSMATTIASIQKIHTIIEQHPILQSFEEFKDLKIFFKEKKLLSDDLDRFLYNLEDETLYQKPSLFSDKGVIIKSYSLVHKLKDLLAKALIVAGNVDAYVGLAGLYTSHSSKETQYSFANYIEGVGPIINLNGFWHPLVDEDKVVTNSIELGNNNRQNMIITGPNEGGKSTTLKAITLCLLMGQTVGIAPAQHCTFTPFSSLATYLNITDDIGVGNSLFKSEVLRTQALLEKLNNLQVGELSFTVFDEIFNGTSPREGEAAAYSIAKHLDSYKNNICIVATHFPLLTKLEEATNSFYNYKVSVKFEDDGSLFYPHKIERGVSNQHIAIDILHNQGFKSCILETANEILRKE